MSIKDITSADFEKEVIQESGTRPVVVDFWAPWCGPCRMITPIIEDLVVEYKDKIAFCKLNIDESPDVASRFSIMSIPTVILFKDGDVGDVITGVKSKSVFKAKFDEFLPE